MNKVAAILMLGCAGLLLTVGPVWADVAGPALQVRVGGTVSGPMLLDSTIGYGSGYNPTAGVGDLAVNTDTGVVYGLDGSSYGYEIARFDPIAEYEKGLPAVNAGIGTTRVYTTPYVYTGSVAGNNSVTNSVSMGVSYDPYMVTNGHAGVITGANSGGAPHWQEYVAQSASEAIGQLNEGTTGTPVNTSAYVTLTTLQDSVGSLGDGGHWNGLTVDTFKSQFAPTNDAASASLNDAGGLVSRYFLGVSTSGGSGNWFQSIYAVHVDATRATEPNATTFGTRNAYFRDRSAAQALVIGGTDFDNLVPSVADLGKDMAVDPVTGDIYILTTTGLNGTAYLSALRPTISNDSDVAISYELVDLDLSDNGGLPGGNAYLQLDTLLNGADLIAGMGLAFSGDGSRLYISVVATTAVTGEVQAVYALDIGRASVPEPATLGLLMLGGLSLAGARIRRRIR
ncbi:MAG: hypothetical protein BIFFINMI_01651 [Phycisphaerae bacterium]|nr:hypothetical protein [Phycisphaerae bacterium]